MKILFVNANIDYGGAVKMLVYLANYLSKKNMVTILTFRDSNELQPLNDNIDHQHKVLYKHPLKIIERFGQLIALHNYIKKEEYDLAISFLHPAKYLLVLACKFTNTKVIVSERGDPYAYSKYLNVFYKLIEKITNTADGFVFQTKEVQNYYSYKIVNKSTVINNPIIIKNIPKQFYGKRTKEIVNVARLDVFQKRQDILLKAFAKISKKYDQYILKFYGDGPDEYKLKKLAEELCINDKVYFMGYVENVLKLINNASIFILSSDFEGIPNALIEAMSIGMPCISTDCSPGGARLLINHNENGLLVPINNPTELATAMDYMLSNPKEADRMACNAMKILNEFKEEKIYGEWEKFINEIIC